MVVSGSPGLPGARGRTRRPSRSGGGGVPERLRTARLGVSAPLSALWLMATGPLPVDPPGNPGSPTNPQRGLSVEPRHRPLTR